jgi:tetratricopeptide (TPR) repeat protein
MAMRVLGGVISFFVFVVAGAALAASQSDRAACADASGDDAIAACTRLMQDRGEPAPLRAAAHYNRGLMHYKGKDYDRAVADLRKALEHGVEHAQEALRGLGVAP